MCDKTLSLEPLSYRDNIALFMYSFTIFVTKSGFFYRIGLKFSSWKPFVRLMFVSTNISFKMLSFCLYFISRRWKEMAKAPAPLDPMERLVTDLKRRYFYLVVCISFLSFTTEQNVQLCFALQNRVNVFRVTFNLLFSSHL